MKEIKLWKNRNTLSEMVCLVDDEDYEKVVEAVRRYRKDGTLVKNSGKWYAHKPPKASSHYAVNGDRRISVHRVVMAPPKGMVVDHINGNALDNRKENLRVCSYSQNSQNRKLRSDSQSGYKGVERVKPYRKKYVSTRTGKVTYHVHRLKKPWRAYINAYATPTRKRKQLGCYFTAEEAARAYDKAAKELFGEFARLNFPGE